MSRRLSSAAHALVRRLRAVDRRIVFVESCTAGLCSATLGKIPGVSAWLCGGFVTYRNASKRDHIGVPESILNGVGPVSPECAAAMAEGALTRTVEADMALSVTGHLGPDAPPDLDGQVFVGVAVRGKATQVFALRQKMGTTRVARQRATVVFVYEQALATL